MFQTLLECKTGPLKKIASVCTSSSEFVELVNEACEALVNDDWPGLIVPIHVCVRRGCVVWPRYVAHVRAMNLCRHQISIKNLWWDFMPRNRYADWCGSECRMVQSSKSPVYSDIAGDARYIRAYPTLKLDAGKIITIFGVDNGNQPLRHKNDDGSWSDGIEITLAIPYATTTTYVRRIDRVLPPDDMQGIVRLYAYNTTDAVLEDIALYEPGETNPEYARYQLNVPCGTSGVNALVKLRYIPARFDTDLVLLPVQALKPMVQSIKAGEDRDLGSKVAFEKEAIRCLNQRMRNEFPDSQIPINAGAFGGVSVGQAVF